MKAAFIQKTGSPDDIQFGELPVPAILGTQVLVRTTAVAVDPIDTYIRAGLYKVEMPLPFIIGRDMTGVVVEVGSSVSKFKPGDRVWANNQGYGGRHGTFAELLSIDEQFLYRLPDCADGKETVAVLHSALTAVVGLFNKAELRGGQTLFINGGSGNVGTAVLQIAKHLGAKVAVTAGSETKSQHCRRHGADLVIDYHKDSIGDRLQEFAPDGVNVFWDASPEPNVETAIKAMSRRGRMLIMSGLKYRTNFPLGEFYTKNCTLYGFTITDCTVGELAQAAEKINQLLEAKVLTAHIEHTMPLSEAAEAHRLMERENLFGKIVLVP